MHKICLVEDEIDLQSLVKTYLEKESYQVTCFERGQDVINCDNFFDLYILDIMLQDDVSGYDIIKHIRKNNSDVPIIFTSARDQDLDRIIGLELGSDDYITKPYSLKELVLRVNNIIKRVYKDIDFEIINYDTYIIDKNKRIVKENEREIKLTTLEFNLLIYLLDNKNKVFSRDDILNSVWGTNYFGSDRAVDDLIRRIRRKMPKLNVNTIYGFGYRLIWKNILILNYPDN